MKNVIVAGSIAYDHLMTFSGKFSESIFPEYLNHLSVSFLADNHKINFGGCGANIAFNLKQLGIEPTLHTVIGEDFEKYFEWFSKHNIETKQIEIDKNYSTAAAYILSDSEENQITFFSVGAMKNTQLSMEIQNKSESIAIISPDSPKRMLSLGESAIKNSIEYIFDPGQQTLALSKKELNDLMNGAIGIIVNEYEADLLSEKMSLKIDEIINKDIVKFIIVTCGEKGSYVFENGNKTLVPSIKNLNVVDTTGAGDGFRAGFLYKYLNNNPILEATKFGNTIASFVVETDGTQNHTFDQNIIDDRLKENY